MSTTLRAAAAAAAAALALALSAVPAAHAQRADATYLEWQDRLRYATRDTVGHPGDPARLDSLGLALMRLARLDEAAQVFGRALAAAPGDDAAEAALGKIALFRGRAATAESLLSAVPPGDPEVAADLYAAHLRRDDWAGAAALAEAAGDRGRRELLERMASEGAYRVAADAGAVSVGWIEDHPLPLLKGRIEGQTVLLAIDTGASDLLLDDDIAKRIKVERLAEDRLVSWNGGGNAVRNAWVRRLDLGGLRIEGVPAGTLKLRRWSIENRPYSEQIGGVIGMNLLRRFDVTLDFERGELELRPRGSTRPGAGADRIPFEVWGESEITVYGTLAGRRRMAMLLHTGLYGAGVGAPAEVMGELGVKPGAISKFVKGAGSALQGRPWHQVTVPSIQVGPLVGNSVPAWSGAMDSGELWRQGVRRDALLGGWLFRDRRLTIDWAARELRVERKD